MYACTMYRPTHTEATCDLPGLATSELIAPTSGVLELYSLAAYFFPDLGELGIRSREHGLT